MSIYRAKCSLCETVIVVPFPREFGSALRSILGHLKNVCQMTRDRKLSDREMDSVAHASIEAKEDA